MKKILVIGGGFAGLATSVYLANQNHKVTVLESSPKLGGRAYSLFNEKQNSFYDNGQHILMGCYKETLNYLSIIDSIHFLEFPSSLSINFVKRNGTLFKLNSSHKLYPFNLLEALLNFRVLSIKSRIKIIDFFLDLLFCYPSDLKDKTVTQWLTEKKQTAESIKNFWGIIVIGALNTSIENASAQIFAEILKRMFLDGTKSSSIIISKVGLSQLYVEPSVRFLSERDCIIELSNPVIKFIVEGNRIVCVESRKNKYADFDSIVSAIPVHSLKRILSNSHISCFSLPDLEYSTILNIHLWLKENPFTERFYGLIDSHVHWVFNHGEHISITISNADSYKSCSEEEILERIYSDLEIFFPIFKSSLVKDFEVIKEKRATFIPDVNSIYLRNEIKVPFENLILTGDWIIPFLPSTIESAVESGKYVIEKI
ncbi:MAG: hydroxysqualene dehydroxylase HpnE [Bacteroidota bacterium]